MTASLIDGKRIAADILANVAGGAAELRARGRPVGLAAVLIGDDPAALSYSRSQAKSAAAAGVNHRLVHLSASASAGEAMAAIDALNGDPSVSGILLHAPVPPPLDAFALQSRIAPGKDVEGVHPASLGLLALGRETLVPCTAAAAFACLKSTGIDLTGRHAVVVGRSPIVGKPLAMLLLAAHCTVTQCHTRTRNLAEHTRRAEVLLVAAGVAGLIGAEHVAPGAIVIDVGTHRVERLGANGARQMVTVGDVRFDEAAPIASHITPVPGGVGPVTVAMLLQNCLYAARRGRIGGC